MSSLPPPSPPPPFDVLLVTSKNPAESPFTQTLEKAGCKVHLSTLSGLKTELTRFPPDVIVLDLDPGVQFSLQEVVNIAGMNPPPVLGLVHEQDLPQDERNTPTEYTDLLVRPFPQRELIRHTFALARASRKTRNTLSSTKRELIELGLARAVQRNLLPMPLPERPRVQIAAQYQPIDQLGGDFFDIVDLGDGASGFFLADVVGHGTSAALFTSFLKAQLLHWSLQMQKEAPGETLTDMNLALSRVFAGTGRFITAVYATYEPGVERLNFANAGHPQPIYLPKEGESYLLEGGEYPLGVVPEAIYQSREIRFAPGDRIVFYTDGICDQRWHGRGEAFTRGRLVQALEATRTVSVQESLEEVMKLVNDWCGGAQEDDLNILAVEAYSN